MLVLDAHRPCVFEKVYSDQRRTIQILLNFISNSLKFTKKDGFIKVHLRVLEEQSLSSEESENDVSRKERRSSSARNNSQKHFDHIIGGTETPKFIKVQMTIEDNGVGISQQNIGKLFSNYARLEEHQEMNAKGTGLGLSICKNIVE